jgi:hypothetical protein
MSIEKLSPMQTSQPECNQARYVQAVSHSASHLAAHTVHFQKALCSMSPDSAYVPVRLTD